MIDKVIPFFDSRLEGLGFRPWDEPFSFENIPESIIDRAYHLDVGQITTGPANQRVHQFTVPILVRIFFKGFSTPKKTRDNSLSEARSVMGDILKPENRLGTDIKDIRPSNVQPIQFSQSQDNLVILELSFNAFILECF